LRIYNQMNLTVESNIRVLPFKDNYPIIEKSEPEFVQDTGTILYLSENRIFEIAGPSHCAQPGYWLHYP